MSGCEYRGLEISKGKDGFAYYECEGAGLFNGTIPNPTSSHPCNRGECIYISFGQICKVPDLEPKDVRNNRNGRMGHGATA